MDHIVLPIVWCRLSLFSCVFLATLVYWLLQILGSGGKRYSCYNFSQEIEEIRWSREVLSEVKDGDSVLGIPLLIQ